MGPILVIAEQENGQVTEASRELLSRARDLAGPLAAAVAVVGFGAEAGEALSRSGADEAFVFTGEGAKGYSPEALEQGVSGLVDALKPGLVLLSNSTVGMDLGASLAARHGLPMVAYAIGLRAEEGALVAESQLYGGKLHAEVQVPSTGAVVTVIPGSWAVSPDFSGGVAGQLSERVLEPSGHLELIRTLAPESGGDVDITRADILVSVGRGIQGPENLDLADELAAQLGGAVSCSRPVVDAGWLPRSRQVGKSGQSVKPKLYLALGISGAPEHLQGMKDSELIIAINSDPAAPIFEVAHYGATVDILDLMPVLTEKLGGGA
jgi:electron transfer flavoprotein alpha subunit